MDFTGRLTNDWWIVDAQSGDEGTYARWHNREVKEYSLREAISAGMLADVRDWRGDSQKDLADILGTSRVSVARWENGKGLDGVTCRALERLYLWRTVPIR